MEERSGDRLVPVPDPHLKSMPSVLASVRMESSESLTELMKQAEHCGVLVSGDAEFDLLRLRIPVPVLRVGVGLDAVAADVEPYRRIECRLLLQEQVRELVVEDGRVFGRAEVAAAMPQSRMVSATRVTSARTPVSRSGVPIWPCRYFDGRRK